MARCGLETGCVIYDLREHSPANGRTRAGKRARRGGLVALASRPRTGSAAHLAVLSGLARRRVNGRARFIECWAAERAGKAGVVLLLESVDRNRLPGMLLHHIGVPRDRHRRRQSGGATIFDTAHIQAWTVI